jgi:hypothetical protein
MDEGKLINGVKYMYIMNENDFKKQSLEDNVYFTLRDIFMNAKWCDICFEANGFNNSLNDGICFEDRTNKFRYTNVLYEKSYVQKLLKWLNHIDVQYFDFDKLEETDGVFDMKTHIKFDDWWVQFEELRNLIKQQYEKLYDGKILDDE